MLNLQLYGGLTVTGAVGTVYSIEYVTDLAQTNDPSAWRCLEYLQLPASPYLWTDKSRPATGQRFYRAGVFTAPTNMVFIQPGTFMLCWPQVSELKRQSGAVEASEGRAKPDCGACAARVIVMIMDKVGRETHHHARTVNPLEHPDILHLQAAVGWLELGNWLEANEELELITPQMRAHPDVLQVRVKIYSAAEEWDYAAEVANGLCTMMPDSSFGPLHLAHALRKLDRTEAAKQVLLPIAHKFPKEWRICYCRACYCCRLGQRKHALRWLQMAIDVAGKEDIRMKALDEPDLESVWREIADI